MNKLLILICIPFLVSCEKDDKPAVQNTSKLCVTEMSFNIKGDNTHYLSSNLSYKTLIASVIFSNQEEALKDIIKINSFQLDDSSIQSITIRLHNFRLTNSSRSEIYDSLIIANINKQDFPYILDYSNTDYLKNFCDSHSSAVSIELTQENNEIWYSYNPDSLSNIINQDASVFKIENQCSQLESIYKGTFSCKLFNRQGEVKEIELGQFNFEL